MSSSCGTERHEPTPGTASAPTRTQSGPRAGAGLITPRTESTSRDLGAWAYRIETRSGTSSSALWPASNSRAERQPAAPDPTAPSAGRPEPWVTKRELAAHLHVAIRWIESQHHNGLPHVRRGGVLRYRISEVERWLCGEHVEGRA